MNWIKSFAKWWFLDPDTGKPDGVSEVFKFMVFVCGLILLAFILWVSWATKGTVPGVILVLVVLYYAFLSYLKSHLDK